MKCNPANPTECGIVDIWEETVPVRFGEIDKSDRLTLEAVFRFFQEAAISHADNLGVGREALAKARQAWILSRMSVLVERRPKYCETVTVRSWPKGGEKLFAMRNYDIRDKDDVPVVKARSAWLIVDMDKRRPVRPQSVMDNLPQNKDVQSLPPETSCNSLKEHGNLAVVSKRKALYTDIDYFGHVNNIKYIEWIEDSLDIDMLINADKIRIDINYLNEILGSENIDILCAPLDASADCTRAFAFEGRKENGQAAFRAELIIWQ